MRLETVFDEFPQLTTSRLLLRSIQDSDKQGLFDIFSKEEVVRFYDVDLFTSLDDADPLISFFQEHFAKQRGIRWAITQREEPTRLIGTCGFNMFDVRGNLTEVGYELNSVFWGKGIMVEALEAITHFALTIVEVHRIEALVVPGNEASVRVLTKVGFRYEGLLRGREYWKNTYHDMRLYSLLQEDKAYVLLNQ